MTFAGDVALVVVALVGSYVLGAVPVGLIVGRIFGGVDVRTTGSGRTGATNVLRTLGWKATVPVVVFDLLKGALAVLAGEAIAGVPGQVAAGVAVVVGHSWSAFIGFGGGRGVIPAAGAALALVPMASVVGVVVGIVLIAAFRYVSLGSLIGTVTCCAIIVLYAALGWSPPVFAPLAIVGGGLIVYSHRGNIARLRAGTERRLGRPADRV